MKGYSVVAARDKIAVIGMMASGKTSIGRAAAENMHILFADADDEIEARAGMAVRDYFARHGEAAFRALEAATIRELLNRPGRLLVALGGGAFMQPDVRDILRNRATTVFLQASSEEIIRRLEQTDIGQRPVLAAAADWRQKTRELTAERDRIYAEADMTLNTDKLTIPEAAAALADRLSGLGETERFGQSPERTGERHA